MSSSDLVAFATEIRQIVASTDPGYGASLVMGLTREAIDGTWKPAEAATPAPEPEPATRRPRARRKASRES